MKLLLGLAIVILLACIVFVIYNAIKTVNNKRYNRLTAKQIIDNQLKKSPVGTKFIYSYDQQKQMLAVEMVGVYDKLPKRKIYIGPYINTGKYKGLDKQLDIMVKDMTNEFNTARIQEELN